MQEFTNEVKLLGALCHPNLMPLLGCCEELDVFALVFPLMKGGDFENRLQNKQLPLLVNGKSTPAIATASSSFFASITDMLSPTGSHTETLLDKVVKLRTHFGMAEDQLVAAVVETAVERLGLKTRLQGANIMAKADACIAALASMPVESLTWKLRLRIVRDAMRGLDYLHRASWLHRDIKPSNILLDINNHARLSDVGLAKEAVSPDAAYLGRTHVSSMMQVGTPGFIDPLISNLGHYSVETDGCTPHVVRTL